MKENEFTSKWIGYICEDGQCFWKLFSKNPSYDPLEGDVGKDLCSPFLNLKPHESSRGGTLFGVKGAVFKYLLGHDVEERWELVCMVSLCLLMGKLEEGALQFKLSVVYGSEVLKIISNKRKFMTLIESEWIHVNFFCFSHEWGNWWGIMVSPKENSVDQQKHPLGKAPTVRYHSFCWSTKFPSFPFWSK